MVRELGLDIDVAYLSDTTLDAAVEGAMRNGWGVTKANVRAVKAKRGTEKLKLQNTIAACPFARKLLKVTAHGYIKTTSISKITKSIAIT